MKRWFLLLLALCLLASTDVHARRKTYGTSKKMPKRFMLAINRSLAETASSRPEDVDTSPVLIEAYLPIYPITRRLARQSGTCRVLFDIGADGLVLNPRVAPAESQDQKMCAHSIIAMRAWRFSPAMKNGIAVEFRNAGSIPFRYKML